MVFNRTSRTMDIRYGLDAFELALLNVARMLAPLESPGARLKRGHDTLA